MIRFASLGSGSEGNCLLVEVDTTRILADCGFSLSETVSRLARCGIAAETVNAIVITHEHDDHIGSAATFSRKYGVPVWLTYGTLQAAGTLFSEVSNIKLFDCSEPMSIGALSIEPYTVPHDAREPAQLVFSDGKSRLGLLTDAGSSTPHMRTVLNALDALIIECNHDLTLLWESNYPQRLKQRIAGKFGHLDNSAAARLLATIDCSRLQHLVAAHLSQRNNTPELAVSALAEALNCQRQWIGVATQRDGFAWREIS